MYVTQDIIFNLNLLYYDQFKHYTRVNQDGPKTLLTMLVSAQLFVGGELDNKNT